MSFLQSISTKLGAIALSASVFAAPIAQAEAVSFDGKRLELDTPPAQAVRAMPMFASSRPGFLNICQESHVLLCATCPAAVEIGAPHLIGSGDGQSLQKIWINLMLRVLHAASRLLTDRHQIHQAHQPVDRISPAVMPLALHVKGHLTRPILRCLKKTEIDDAHEGQVLSAFAAGMATKAGPRLRWQAAVPPDA